MVDQVIQNTFLETYRDDFSDSAGFHRILFNNGRAVQARELTQMQTILQTEISRFGDNIFKDGAIVHSGGFYGSAAQFAKLDETTNPLPADPSTIIDTTFTGATSGVTAVVIHTVSATGSDPATVYLRYINSNGANIRFTPGENITNGSTTLTVQTTNTTVNPALGEGVFLTNNEGVYYVTGRFVFAPKQTILAKKYQNTTDNDDVFGFIITESIVTANDDQALYDNSGPLPNTTAPGADRYKISLTLALQSDVDSDQNFVKVGRLIGFTAYDVKKAASEENYNIILDLIAKRTAEESGDYIVEPFKVVYSDNTTDATKLDLLVQPGVAYVDGYRAEVTLPQKITIDKPRTTTTKNNEVAAFTLGNYVLVDGSTSQGLPNINDFSQVNLRSAVNYGGSTIGTARVRAIDEDNSGNYRLHLFQISMNSGQNFRSVRSIGTGASDYMNTVLELGQNVLRDPKTNSLLVSLPRIRPSNMTDISLATQRRFTASVTAGSASLTLSASGETFSNTNDWIICADDSDVFTGATITGVGTTNATISGLGSASSIEVMTYVNKASGSVRSKTLNTGQEDTIAVVDWDSDGNGTIFAELTKPDVYNFTSVTRDTVSGTSVRSRFILDNGQRDNYYGLGRLVLKSGQSVPTYPVVVKYDYFSHGVSGDFFAVNSYTGQVDYEDIPSHTTSTGTVVPLRNVLDFRPVVNSSGTFGSGAIVHQLPQPNDTIQADISYYNARWDQLIIDTKSDLKVITGQEDLDPNFAKHPENSLELYRIQLKPYTLDYKDLISKQIEHKHYTMADIGLLEKRVNALEEVTSLSLLELDTANLAVLDSDGNNRTKSGFFVDNFSNHFFSDLSAIDYAASIDPVEKFMRPRGNTDGINLMYDSDNSENVGVVKRGDNIYLQYSHNSYINQDVASRTENVIPFWQIRFQGHVILSPASDNWIEQQYQPDAVTNQTQLDTSGANLWNSHEWNWGGTPLDQLSVGSVTNTITLSSSGGSSTSVNETAGQFGTGGTETVASSWSSTTTGNNVVVGETTITQVTGDRLIQAVAIPFMRSRKIYFQGRGFRPDTQVFPFFDGVDVSDWCRSETFVRVSDNATTVGNVSNNALGHPEGSSTLIADANGDVEGSFFIPSTGNLRFSTGTKTFLLIDVTNPDNAEFSTSLGRQTFTSLGTLQTRQRDVLSTRVLEIDSRTNSTSSSSSRVVATTTNPPPPPPVIPDPPQPPVQPPRPNPNPVLFSCFVAGTQVTMADGSKKNIEDVLIGEKLLGQDGVINTVLKYDHPMLNGRDLIALNGGKPFMTPEHPLMTKEGWKSWSAETTKWQKPDIAHLMVNGDLQVGDEILTDNGDWLMIESIEVHSGEPEQQVYNFYLDGNNTYFADGLLAHNRGNGSCFVAGTKVIMADGTEKNIEDIEIGEMVQGVDGVNKVLAFDHPMLDGRKLIGINGSGPFKTPEHPLLTADGWKAYDSEITKVQKPQIAHLMTNGSLEIGDKIRMADGSWVTIESIEVFENEPQQQVYNFVLDGDHTYFANGMAAHNRDPLAQSFTVSDKNGVFLTKVDVYFATKDTGTAPVWGQIRAMENGYPAPKIMGGSTVFKFPSEITTSTDGSVATTFEFDEPVYLTPGKEYCWVMISTVPSYTVYTSKVGDYVLGTTDKKIVKQPFLGSLFKSQNNTTWTATQWEDMKIHIHSAKFTTNAGKVVLTNTDVPTKLLTEDPLSVDSADATITVYQPNHGFTVGDTVELFGATDMAGISANSINGTRTVTKVDATGYQFEADSASTSAEIGGGDGIVADQNILMDVLNVNLATLLPDETNIIPSVKTTTGQSIAGTETAYQLASAYKKIELGKNIYFDAPQMIANYNNETTYLAGAKSFNLRLDMQTVDEKVSPVVDLQRATVLAINNIIDKPSPTPAAGFNVPINYVAETNPKGGSAVAKHISKVITLAQDAVGMKVFLTANKPNGASFDLYYRVASGDANISDISWTAVTATSGLISDDNPQVFREYEYLIGGNTGDLDAFNQMQIKIVMVSENQSKVPVFKDIRSIALAV